MEDGAINGNASCNRFFGQYTYSNTVLVIGALGSTKMMCLPSLMEQEQRLLEHLLNATQVRLENGLLILQDGSGASLITASREEPQAP
jgi:heat shock protein HslJ